MIGGQGIFCQEKDPYSYEAEGANYFDMERGPSARRPDTWCSSATAMQ